MCKKKTIFPKTPGLGGGNINRLALKNLSQKKITQNISFCLTVNVLHDNISPFPQGTAYTA